MSYSSALKKRASLICEADSALTKCGIAELKDRDTVIGKAIAAARSAEWDIDEFKNGLSKADLIRQAKAAKANASRLRKLLSESDELLSVLSDRELVKYAKHPPLQNEGCSMALFAIEGGADEMVRALQAGVIAPARESAERARSRAVREMRNAIEAAGGAVSFYINLENNQTGNFGRFVRAVFQMAAGKSLSAVQLRKLFRAASATKR